MAENLSSAVWSKDTYRIDQISQQFKLPCVIRVEGGFCGAIEEESISNGDIIKVEQDTHLRKVAAYFVDEEDLAIGTITFEKNHEVIIPQGYKGPLKRTFIPKTYLTVKEVATDMPRLVEVMQKLKPPSDFGNTLKKIKPGTILEPIHVKAAKLLEPSSQTNKSKFQEKLFFRVKHGKGEEKETVVALPVEMSGTFTRLPDENAYTLKDITEHFQLPQLITIMDENIEQIFADHLQDDLDETVDFRVSKTLRINRIVDLHVLLGHYKGVEENVDTLRCSVVMIPLDARFVREFEVSVFVAQTEEEHNRVIGNRFSTALEIDHFDENMYAQLVSKPRLKFFDVSTKQADETVEEPAANKDKEADDQASEYVLQTHPDRPPLPPRRPLIDSAGNLRRPSLDSITGGKSSPAKSGKKAQLTTIVEQPENEDAYDFVDEALKKKLIKEQSKQKNKKKTSDKKKGGDASAPEQEYMDKKKVQQPNKKQQKQKGKEKSTTEPAGSATKEGDVYMGMSSLKTSEPSTYMDMNAMKNLQKTPQEREEVGTEARPGDRKNSLKSNTESPLPERTRPLPPPPRPHVTTSSSLPLGAGSFSVQRNLSENFSVKKEICSSSSFPGTESFKASTPDADMPDFPAPPPPMSSTQVDPVKDLKSLKVKELEERLIFCGLVKLASECLKEKLDGRFFLMMSEDEFLDEPFGCTKFELMKVKRIKDNWVPKD